MKTSPILALLVIAMAHDCDSAPDLNISEMEFYNCVWRNFTPCVPLIPFRSRQRIEQLLKKNKLTVPSDVEEARQRAYGCYLLGDSLPYKSECMPCDTPIHGCQEADRAERAFAGWDEVCELYCGPPRRHTSSPPPTYGTILLLILDLSSHMTSSLRLQFTRHSKTGTSTRLRVSSHSPLTDRFANDHRNHLVSNAQNNSAINAGDWNGPLVLILIKVSVEVVVLFGGFIILGIVYSKNCWKRQRRDIALDGGNNNDTERLQSDRENNCSGVQSVRSGQLAGSYSSCATEEQTV